MLKYMLVAIYLILNALGTTLIKFGGDSLFNFKNGNVSFSMNFTSAFGFVCYIISFLLWTKILTIFDLGYIVPIALGISQVLMFFIGFGVFDESFSIMGILGISFIIVGVIFLNIK